jgi:hypothetical protein
LTPPSEADVLSMKKIPLDDGGHRRSEQEHPRAFAPDDTAERPLDPLVDALRRAIARQAGQENVDGQD